MSRFVRNISGIHDACGPYVAARYMAAIALSLPEVLRCKSLGPADKWMASGRWRFSLQGTDVEVSGEHFGLCRELYARKIYFPTSEFDLQSGDMAVDLGANIGLFSVLAARAGCRVVAVEAQRGFVAELERFAAVNRVLDRIEVEHGLVGGRAGIFADREKLYASSHFQDALPPVLTMDEIIAAHSLDMIDFLKIDIEGSEFDLITAEAMWLERVQKIAMEVHPEFGDVANLMKTLVSAGFRVESRNNSGVATNQLNGVPGHLYAWRG